MEVKRLKMLVKSLSGGEEIEDAVFKFLRIFPKNIY